MRPEDDAHPMPPLAGVLHENFARPDEIVEPSDRRFGLTIAAILGTIGGGRLALGHSHSGWWLGAAAVLALFALYRPAVRAAPLHGIAIVSLIPERLVVPKPHIALWTRSI